MFMSVSGGGLVGSDLIGEWCLRYFNVNPFLLGQFKVEQRRREVI